LHLANAPASDFYSKSLGAWGRLWLRGVHAPAVFLMRRHSHVAMHPP
jgi:hypothetical protein